MSRAEPAHRGVAYFAAFLDLLGKSVVVVGGGRVASSKVRALLPCKPSPLVVVAPRVSAAIQGAAADGKLRWLQREYRAGDLDGAALAFGASDDRELNARVAADARALGIPVLAVDDVPNCDFIAPALVRRGDLTIAISTAGRSPAVARRTREYLERTLPRHWADLLDVAAAAREQLGATRSLVDGDTWQRALDDVENLVASGGINEATGLLTRKLEHSLFEDSNGTGFVSLVGAGPGDPDLLTLRAVERLRKAQVVVHDRLVSDRVLEFVPPDAERVDVGKRPGGEGPSQQEINRLLVELGSQAKRVVRLKGGDPFVFGRGGEEALALARAGVPFEVVPGVSSALAAPAAAGIPVTHRGMSASFTVVNGHDVEEHDWHALAASAGTLVFLMAVEHLEDIAAQLLARRSPNEPCALVEWATTPRERIVTAPLQDLVQVARLKRVQPPAVLVVGPTAALAERIGHRAAARRDTALVAG
jgi:uroporphyrin-III C-methyltransferase / precorrin-2 dehydrogenase / sirohydrochlorin ferrochelatase